MQRQPVNSNSNVQNERRSLLSLGKLRRVASFKSMVQRAQDNCRKAFDPEKQQREA